MAPGRLVRFGDYEFNLHSGELRRAVTAAVLAPQPAEFLRALVERPGELITRAEMRARLWPPELHLDFDHALNKIASKVRAALQNGGGEQEYFETLSRRGYRFVAPVEAVAPRPGETDEEPVSGRLRLAVLPYQNLTGERQWDDLADGLAEETVSRLGALLRGGIRIIAHASARHYRDSPFPVAHIARDLAVDCVLTGAVARGGSGYELRLELVAAADQARLWAGKVGAEAASGLFLGLAPIEEIAQVLSARVRVLPAKCEPLRPGAAGREAYLRARRLWHQRTGAALQEALAEYRRAIRHEPAFALAYAGIAECYMMLNSWGTMAPKPSQELADEAAQKALELNPCLAEAHVVAAYSRMILGDDWAGAEQAFRAAISRNPSCSVAHQLFGYWLVPRGVFGRGLAANLRALELDPMAAPIHAVRAWLLASAGRVEEAIASGERALELHPGHVAAHYHTGIAYSCAGRHREAIAHHEAALRISGGMCVVRATLAASLARGGERAAAEAHMAIIEREHNGHYVCGFMAGVAYAALGQTERAVEWIARSFEEREPHVAFANVDPRLAELRSERAFAPTLRGIREWLQVN